MATPATRTGTKLYLKIVDGGSPEVFSHPCLINAERGVAFRSSTNDVVVPDCTNPDDPAWRELVKDALNVGLNGAGIMDNTVENYQAYTEWWKLDEARNVQIWVDTLGYWSGAFKLTEWEITGNRGEKINASITLESDGIVSDFTPGTP